MQITEVTVPEQHLIVQRHTLKKEEIGGVLGTAFGQTWALVQQHGLTPAAPPVARWLRFDEDSIEVEAGLPITTAAPDLKGDNGYYLYVPELKAVRGDYYGPYDGLQAAWQALCVEMEARKLTISGPCWEHYITDPMEESDPAKWLTQIYLPHE